MNIKNNFVLWKHFSNNLFWNKIEIEYFDEKSRYSKVGVMYNNMAHPAG
jgi:hypothetical protein